MRFWRRPDWETRGEIRRFGIHARQRRRIPAGWRRDVWRGAQAALGKENRGRRAQSHSARDELRASSDGRENRADRNWRGRQARREATRNLRDRGRPAVARPACSARSDAGSRGHRGGYAPALRSLRLEYADREWESGADVFERE